MNNQQTTRVEPTHEFDAECVGVMQAWRRGEIPFQQAIETLTRLSNDAQLERHTANWGRAEHLLGYMQHYRGNLNISINHYNQAYRLFARINNRKRMATMDLNQGENYRNKGEYMKARNLYRSAYEIAADLNDIAIQSMALTNEGLAMIELGDIKAAREVLLDALELAGEWDQADEQLPMLLCEIHQALATVYLAEDELDLAGEQASLALDNATISAQPIQMGYANRILGDVLTAKYVEDGQKNPDIDRYYRSAMKCFHEVRAEGESARTMYAHATSYGKRSQRRKASQMFHSAMVTFTKLGMTADAARAAEAQLAML